ncbi:hypothetical protein [Saccharicrinis aurantiacus]|uniref:hypothetical protein n=1 Tax=Saccharicrinis aurantiacus TaxID=1849719 RepID=UPI0009501204|nr:hypothetical protein [Saccharicrinis aurantiacus]
MKTSSLFLTAALLSASLCLRAEEEPKVKFNQDQSLLKSAAPAASVAVEEAKESEEAFKPSVSVGGIIHMFASSQQKGYNPFSGSSAVENGSDWNNGFQILRSRIMLGAQLTEKANFFMETEIPLGSLSGVQGQDKNIPSMPTILDCQFEYVFNPAFSVIAGQQLVAHNRNGLQGAAGLLANDFTYYQYPHNMFQSDPLQNYYGRDLGVNFRGIVLNDKLEYRLGFFAGRTQFEGEDSSPLRTVGRLVYNIFDADKNFYYNGTNLGEGKTLSIGAGFDTQGTYSAIGADVFADMPAGDAGSFTVNGAFSHITGGNDPEAKYSFSGMIPTQNTQLLEAGYYFKKTKLQPYVRYERQAYASEDKQVLDTESFDKYNSNTVLGAGVNYWFNSYNTNLRASYTTTKSDYLVDGADKSETYGQFWLQVQIFIF